MKLSLNCSNIKFEVEYDDEMKSHYLAIGPNSRSIVATDKLLMDLYELVPSLAISAAKQSFNSLTISFMVGLLLEV